MTLSASQGHKSVLVDEVLTYLDPQPGKVYLDVTFGAGGHTRAILEKEPGCRVIGLDWDQISLDTFGDQLVEEFGPERLRLLWGNFALLYKIAKKEGIKSVDGILADFGTSQMQLRERKGFSFNTDTPLDMRMSPSHYKVTAAELVNKASEQKLAEIFWEYGQERNGRQIAQAIVQARILKPITTTAQLAQIVESVVPFKKNIHPATQVFQALRMYVNNELENIRSFLAAAEHLLVPGGRLVCISFHSLEDRLVKQYFKDAESLGRVKLLTPHVVTASEDELERNPSARSACLRAALKL